MPNTDRRLPDLIAHADWSIHSDKRWIAVARRRGSTYELKAPELVGDVSSLLRRLGDSMSQGPIVVGFDFPIGVPSAYAKAAKIEKFADAITAFGFNEWSSFYDVAEDAKDVSQRRPFYPYRPGGTSQARLLEGLGMSSMTELLRLCERGHDARGAASSLFWTLGAKQVGKAAITGWRDVIAPALRGGSGVSIWPFHGDLDELLRDSSCILVESYPAEACSHVGITCPSSRSWSKRSQQDRKVQGGTMTTWMRSHNIGTTATLERQIKDGFGAGNRGEDPFDAVLGLMSMAAVLLGNRGAGAPADPLVRSVEGGYLASAHNRESFDQRSRSTDASSRLPRVEAALRDS